MPRKSRKIESLQGGGTTINRATETDRYVGGRIRERRIMLGLSQQQMADMIGVSYQQTHKYERGINRISAGRLYEIAQVLRVPMSFFFEGLGDRPEGGVLTGRQTTCHARPLHRSALPYGNQTNQWVRLAPFTRHPYTVYHTGRVLSGNFSVEASHGAH